MTLGVSVRVNERHGPCILAAVPCSGSRSARAVSPIAGAVRFRAHRCSAAEWRQAPQARQLDSVGQAPTEGQHPVATHAARVQEAGERGAQVQRVLEARRPGRWSVAAAASPEVAARRARAWVVSPSGTRPARAAASRTARQVDGRRQVLAADVPERVAADAVPGEPAQGAVAPAGGVERGGLLGVVDEDDDPAVEARRSAPASQSSMRRGRPRRPGRPRARSPRRRGARPSSGVVGSASTQDESARCVQPDAAAPGRPAGRPITRWTGQRVQHLVRDASRRRPAGRPPGRRSRRAPRRARPPRAAPGSAVEPGELDLDRPVADRREERRARVTERGEHALGKRAGSRAVLDDPRRAPDASAPSTPPPAAPPHRRRRSDASRRPCPAGPPGTRIGPPVVPCPGSYRARAMNLACESGPRAAIASRSRATSTSSSPTDSASASG